MCRANFTEIKTEKSTKRVEPLRRETGTPLSFYTILIEFLESDVFKMRLASDFLSASPDSMTVIVCLELWRALNDPVMVGSLSDLGVAQDSIVSATECLRVLLFTSITT